MKKSHSNSEASKVRDQHRPLFDHFEQIAGFEACPATLHPNRQVGAVDPEVLEEPSSAGQASQGWDF